MDIERKRINISSKRQITIPKKYFDALGFGVEAEISLRGNEIIIKPVSDNGGGDLDREILLDLVSQGYSGDELIKQFTAAQKKVRPAVELMLAEAANAAIGTANAASYEDIFGSDDRN